MHRYASVIVDIPTQSIDTAFTYGIPPQMAGQCKVGCPVVVPFGNRRAVGFVMDCAEQPFDDSVAVSKIKDIIEVAAHSYFDENAAACARYLSQRYIAPLSTCVRLFTPPAAIPRCVKRDGAWQVEQPKVGQVDERWVRLGPQADNFVCKKSAIKQAHIIEALQTGELRVAELTTEFGPVNAALTALEKLGVVVVETRRRMRGVEQSASAFTPSEKPPLTEGQACALNAIRCATAAHDGQVVLVDGVTGSGKTEVYLQAIEDVIQAGKRAIVLVPEISLTPQTVGRFRGRFGDAVAVMHSRMSAGERFDQWDFIKSGSAKVVVGARSALFTPMENVGLIVIDEEHEGSYKQDSAPRYVSRDVAAWMVKRLGATLVLGSATPSVEALHNCASLPDWSSVLLPERANGKPLPAIEVIDMAREFGSGSRSMFSRALTKALEQTLAAGDKAVLLLNQRGFAKFLLCRDCGYVPECPSCSTSLTYHETSHELICHHCGYAISAPAKCPECGSPYLRKFGAGTQRVEAELVATISDFKGVGDVPVIRMDADTTTAKGSHQRLLDSFALSEAAVLLGTQMIAKGLDFDDVTLVGVINADTQLNLPDFRAAERTFDLIQQVAGRAGRASKLGRVLVQTYCSQTIPIQAAAHYDRAFWLKDELAKRKLLSYPPYVRMADVLFWGKNEDAVRACAGELFELLEKQVAANATTQVSLLPPTPCVLARLRGNFRYHITVRADVNTDISAVIAPVFKTRRVWDDVNVAVDVDPYGML